MKSCILHRYGKKYPIQFIKASYPSGVLAIAMNTTISGYVEPYDTLTTYLTTDLTNDQCGYVKSGPEEEGYSEFILNNNLGKKTGKAIRSGFNTYEEFEFDFAKMNINEEDCI